MASRFLLKFKMADGKYCWALKVRVKIALWTEIKDKTMKQDEDKYKPRPKYEFFFILLFFEYNSSFLCGKGGKCAPSRCCYFLLTASRVKAKSKDLCYLHGKRHCCDSLLSSRQVQQRRRLWFFPSYHVVLRSSCVFVTFRSVGADSWRSVKIHQARDSSFVR